MFKDTTVKLLGSSYSNTTIKVVNGDFQDNNRTLEFEDYKYKCTKILFVDCIESLLEESFYINVNNRIYRIIKSEQYDDYMEIYLFLCDFRSIKVNEIDKKALILNIADKINYEDDKIIIADFPIKTGDIVEYQNLKWFVISQIDTNINTLKARIKKVEQNFKIYIDNILKEVPSIYEVATQTIMEGQELRIVDGNIKALIQDNYITQKITYGNRFIKMNSAWKVEGFTTEHKGLRTLYLSKDLFNDKDDKENEIANRWLHEEKYDYKIISDSIINLNNGEMRNIKTTITNFGIKIDNPVLTYSVLDRNVITVDNIGNVTAMGIGNAEITVRFIGADGQEYSTIVIVNVSEIKPVEVVTYEIHSDSVISGEFTIRRYVTKEIRCDKFINGVKVNNAVFIITYETTGLDMSKFEIDISNPNAIDIYNRSLIDGTMIVSFEDADTGIISTQEINFIK